jgi:NAD(P)-dependent dehydrogenase (short-subunit alcohol dehydrogenase family)
MRFASYPSLTDANVVVTGGASGIGAGLVKAFAGQGARVFSLDIDGDAAADFLEHSGRMTSVQFLYCDLRDIEHLQATLADIEQEAGPVAVLINNAGRDDRAALSDMSVAEWDDMMAVNLRHVAFACQAVARGMKARGGGSIVNFTSPSIRRRTANLSAYGAAKAGIEGLTRILAREYGEAGIRVNAVMPGWTMTRRQRERWLTAEAERTLMETQCLKEFVQVEDVARLVLFLAADDSRLMTAHTYMVDAGLV